MNLIRRMNRKNKFDPRNSDFYPPHRHISLAPKLNLDDHCLPYFTALLFTAIIEDLIMKVGILSQMNNTLKIEKLMADAGLLRSLKYSVTQTKAGDELDAIDSGKIECKEYKLYKLVEDRKYLLKILADLYKDLANNKSYQTLCKHITYRMERDGYHAKLSEEERANRLCRRELYKQLRTLRNQHKAILLDTNQMVEDLRIRVEDQSMKTAIRVRYTEKWENSRNEQHMQTILDAQRVPASSGDQFKIRLESEQRAHGEIEMLTNIRINEVLKEVNHWMTKFESDMENIDLKIQIKKIEYTDTKDKRLDLENTLIDHDNDMKNWIKFKEDREAQRQYVIKMQNAAIVVQAWWRGILVRNNLGPFYVRAQGPRRGKASKKGKK